MNKLTVLGIGGGVLLAFGALLVSFWLVARFIFDWPPHEGDVPVREIIAFIFSGVLLMMIGVYLCVYRAKYDLEIARLIRTASADLVRSIDALRQVLASGQPAPKSAPAQEENLEFARSIRGASASLFRSIDDLRQVLAFERPVDNPPPQQEHQ